MANQRTQVATSAFTQSDGMLDTTNWVSHDNADLVSTTTAVDTNRFTDPYSGTVSFLTWKGAGSFGNDQYAKIDYSGVSGNTGDSVGVLVRANAILAITAYELRIYPDATNNLQLRKLSAATPSTLDQRTVTLGASGTITLEVIGTTLYVYLNESLQYTLVDSSISTGKPGISSGCQFGSGIFGDNFDSGNVAAAAGGGPLTAGLVEGILTSGRLIA